MTKQEKLKAIEKAIDMGAEVGIIFHNCKTQQEAEGKVKVLASLLNSEYYLEECNGTEWFEVGQQDNENDSGLEISAFF